MKTLPRLYRPGQLTNHLLPHVGFTPEWFIDCGLASGGECLDARAAWPGVKLLALEPSPIGFEAARSRFPTDNGAHLLHVAAWVRDGIVDLYRPDELLRSTCLPFPGAKNRVLARSLDSLDRELGPFCEAVLWIDVEGAEAEVLAGTEGLIERRAVRVINLEIANGDDNLVNFLRSWGFRQVSTYHDRDRVHEEVWVLEAADLSDLVMV